MQPGSQLGQYQILAAIGKGGMGEVWKGRDTNLGREVAIKFLHPRLAASLNAVERLRIEARAASGMNHPNICTIYDLSEHDGTPYIVMELMNGENLQDRLRKGCLKTGEVVEVGLQVADALDAAHGRGIIHRDIKPANIFVTESGLVKVLDFGLAKMLPQHGGGVDTTTTPTSDQLTAVGAAIGTVAYMSPEQASGEELDGRTDLFSLGVVLYNCATGMPPFSGKTAAVVLSSILNRAPVPPTSINPEIPLQLQSVINNCLEKDRALRYQAAVALVTDLKRVKRDMDVLSLETTGSLSTAGLSTDVQLPEDPASEEISKSKRTWMAAGALAVLGAIVSLALVANWTGPVVPIDPVAQIEAGSQAFIENRVELASENLAAGNYLQALIFAQEILDIAPDHADAAELRDAAQTEVVRFDDAVTEARRWVDAGDAERASDALETMRSIEPSAPAVAEISGLIVTLLESQVAEARAAASQNAAAAQAAPDPAPAPADPSPDELATGVPPAVESQQEPDVGAAVVPEASTNPEAIQAVTLEPVPEPEPELPSPVVAPVPLATEPTPEETVTPVPPALANAVVPASPEETTLLEVEPTTPTLEEDQSAIESVVVAYGRAIETKNLGLFREVKPNLSEIESERLVAAFDAVGSQQVDLTIISLDLSGDAATVRVNRTDTIEADGVRQTASSQQTLEFVRATDGWVIETIGQ